MRQRGFEPPRGFPHGRLRTARIPFRHCRAEQSLARNPSELDANIRSRIMHAPQAVAESLELHRLGLNAVEISQRVGVPRRTVSDWIGGRVPRQSGAGACPRCGRGAHDAEQLPPQYAYLLGAYLGDGCISAHPRGVFRLRIALDARYPGIVSEVARATKRVMPGNAVGIVVRPYRCVDVSSPAKAQLHERRCYAFRNVSTDIQDIFCLALELVDIRWTLAGEQNVYVSRKADVARMDEFIGPKT